jgi:hypothetical protein
MKRFAYLLVLALLWVQVDDAWAVVPVTPSAPLANDVDDEYLPSQRRSEQEEASSARQNRLFVSREPQVADFPPVRRGALLERGLTTPFTAPPLYLLMSLQI